MTRVRDYYDANTWKFLLTGNGKSLHRELWADGVKTRREAIDHVHELVLTHLGEEATRVIDLGCGVGAACFYLAERRAVEVHGVSVSGRQVAIANRLARRQGSMRGKCAFWEGDFCALSPGLRDGLGGADLAFSIEAFVHAPGPASYFATAAAILRPGGRLVVIDDFLVDGTGQHPLVDDFRAGWEAPSVMTLRRATELAAGHGFKEIEAVDLTRLMRIGRPRDRVIRALLPVLKRAARHSLWAQSLVGGDALQACYRKGFITYQMLVLERLR